MDKPLYEATIELLYARKGDWPLIARETEIPYSTICKLAQRHHDNPSVHTVQKLFDFLRTQQAA